MITAMGLEHSLFGLANIPMAFVSLWQSCGILVGVIFVVCMFVGVALYGWWLDHSGKVWLEARRLHKTMSAMLVVFGFVLFFAGYEIFKAGLSMNVYSTTIVFIVSLLGMARWKTKIPMIFYFLISAVIVYFIH